jgi:hypothetical protein
MAYADGLVWLIGDFTSLRPPGDTGDSAAVAANGFVALHADSGAPDTSVDMAHVFSGQPPGTGPLTHGAVAISPDGGTVYVGGNFTSVDGQVREHIAAFSASTGALLPWNPDIDGSVRAIAASGPVVYVGGDFGRVNDTQSPFLVALSAADASVMPWGTVAPTPNDAVEAIAVSPDGTDVAAGGYFTAIDGNTESPDGATAYNSAALIAGVGTPAAGTLLPLPADRSAVPVATTDCSSAVKDIVMSGNVAYFADEGTGLDCFDGTWAVNLSDGSLVWVNRCLGATQTVAVVGNYLYKGSHIHDCQTTNTNGDPDNFPEVPINRNRHLTSESLDNGFLGPWYPNMNAGPNLGPRTMATDGSQLYVGGDFTAVNGVPQQGIARFTATTDFPTPAPARPIVTRDRAGRALIRVVSPVDLDDPDLTLELFRVGSSAAIATTNVHSLFWRQPIVHWVDSAASATSHPSYRVSAVPTGALTEGSLSPAASVVSCRRPGHLPAKLTSVTADSLSLGARRIDVVICAGPTVSVALTATRKGSTFASRTAHYASTGLHVEHLRVPKRVKAGKATIRAVIRRQNQREVLRQSVKLPSNGLAAP